MDNIKKGRFGDTEFKNGYVQALEGIMVSFRTGDERDFLNKTPFDKKSLSSHKKDFKKFVQDDVNSPFDVGYFMAWSDFLLYKLDNEKTS